MRLEINSVWLLIGRIGAAASSLVITLLLAKWMGVHAYGQYTYIMTVVFLLGTMASAGMDTYQLRLVSKERPEVIPIGSVLLIQGGATLLLILLTLLLSPVVIEDKEISNGLQLYVFILIPILFITPFNASIKGLEKMNVFVIFSLIDQLSQLLAICLIVNYAVELKELLIALILTKIFNTALLVAYFRWASIKVRMGDVGSFRQIMGMITSGGWITLSVLLFILIQRMGIFFLASNTSSGEVGNFSVANRIIEALKMLPAAYYGALFPIMIQGGERLQHEKKTLVPLGILMLFIVGGLFVFSNPLMTTLFDGFESSGAILQILCIGFLPFLVRQYFSFQLFSKGEEKIAFIALFIATGFAVPAFHFSTLYFGAEGLAWALVLVLGVELVSIFILKEKVNASGLT